MRATCHIFAQMDSGIIPQQHSFIRNDNYHQVIDSTSKIGFPGDIVSKIEGAIGKPIEEVKHVLGEVEDFGEDIVKTLLQIVKEVENLCSVSKIESIFFTPFRDASHIASGLISEIKLVEAASAPLADGVKETITNSAENVYTMLKDAVKRMISAVDSILIDLHEKDSRMITAFHREIAIIKSLSETLSNEVHSLEKKIKEAFKVERDKIFSVPQKFVFAARKAEVAATHKITTVGDTVVQDYENILASIKRKFENNNAAFDMMIGLIMVMIIGGLIATLVITKSIHLVATLMLVIFISFIFYIFGS